MPSWRISFLLYGFSLERCQEYSLVFSVGISAYPSSEEREVGQRLRILLCVRAENVFQSISKKFVLVGVDWQIKLKIAALHTGLSYVVYSIISLNRWWEVSLGSCRALIVTVNLTTWWWLLAPYSVWIMSSMMTVERGRYADRISGACKGFPNRASQICWINKVSQVVGLVS